jgi:hypothetical protein
VIITVADRSNAMNNLTKEAEIKYMSETTSRVFPK